MFKLALLILMMLSAVPNVVAKSTEVFVRAVKGSAYTLQTNGVWKPLRPGMLLPGGSSIRTGASSITSYDLLFTGQQHVVRFKSDTTSSLVHLIPSHNSQVSNGMVSGAGSSSSDYTRLDISPDGLIQVNSGSLRITYLDQEKEKPDHVTVSAGQSFKAPVRNPSQTSSEKQLQPVFEVMISNPGKFLPPTGINVRVPVISP